MHILTALASASIISTGPTPSNTPPQPPPGARSAHFDTNTFTADFTDARAIIGQSGPWFFTKPSSLPTTKPSEIVQEPSGILLQNDPVTSNYTISTIDYQPGNAWRGIAFGCGGYFEAGIRVNPQALAPETNAAGFPAWWLFSLEHARLLPSQHLVGKPPGYMRFAELDAFEYPARRVTSDKWYYATAHEWSGIYKFTCEYNYCDAANNGKGLYVGNNKIPLPENFDFSEFHRYGVLWIPATQSNPGTIQFFFDGNPTTSKVSWDKKNTNGLFSSIDSTHFILVLGSGQAKMEINSVAVWQGQGRCNISQH